MAVMIGTLMVLTFTVAFKALGTGTQFKVYLRIINVNNMFNPEKRELFPVEKNCTATSQASQKHHGDVAVTASR